MFMSSWNGPITEKHLPQDCPTYASETVSAWPTETPVTEKTHCILKDMRMMSTYIRAKGSILKRTSLKRSLGFFPAKYVLTCVFQ